MNSFILLDILFMRLKENYSIRKIGDEFMMISHHESSLDYTRVISLNDSAAYLIGETGHHVFTSEEWVALLIEKYGIDRTLAEIDVQVLVDKLIRENLVDA